MNGLSSEIQIPGVDELQRFAIKVNDLFIAVTLCTTKDKFKSLWLFRLDSYSFGNLWSLRKYAYPSKELEAQDNIDK